MKPKYIKLTTVNGGYFVMINVSEIETIEEICELSMEGYNFSHCLITLKSNRQLQVNDTFREISRAIYL